MDSEFKQQVCEAFDASGVVECETIQGLWSGYGKIARYELIDGVVPGWHVPGSNLLTRVIAKHVRIPEAADHPRGWNTDQSRQRKIKSYEVEVAWYAKWSHKCPETCRIPRYLVHFTRGQETLLLLEDLDASGYPLRKTSITLDEFDACVVWLAHFHAAFLYQVPDGLWKKGTYWHLETRFDELEALEDSALKQAAKAIDQALSASPFQTFVHGDAKLANFCFSETGQVAAVDFQYVGCGCGMKDLAYFVGSCFDSEECFRYEEHVLQVYFESLKNALRGESIEVDTQALESDWRHLYPYAWADFQRFLKGWSPGHWKLGDYSHQMTSYVLDECLE